MLAAVGKETCVAPTRHPKSRPHCPTLGCLQFCGQTAEIERLYGVRCLSSAGLWRLNATRALALAPTASLASPYCGRIFMCISNAVLQAFDGSRAYALLKAQIGPTVRHARRASDIVAAASVSRV